MTGTTAASGAAEEEARRPEVILIMIPDDEAWAYVDEDVDITGEINPGNTLKTTVPFDVPKKVEPDYLLLKAGVFGFSEGVGVKL